MAEPVEAVSSFHDELKALVARHSRLLFEVRGWQVENANQLAAVVGLPGDGPAEPPASNDQVVEFYCSVIRAMRETLRKYPSRTGTIAGASRIVYDVAKEFGLPMGMLPGPIRLPRAAQETARGD